MVLCLRPMSIVGLLAFSAAAAVFVNQQVAWAEQDLDRCASVNCGINGMCQEVDGRAQCVVIQHGPSESQQVASTQQPSVSAGPSTPEQERGLCASVNCGYNQMCQMVKGYPRCIEIQKAPSDQQQSSVWPADCTKVQCGLNQRCQQAEGRPKCVEIIHAPSRMGPPRALPPPVDLDGPVQLGGCATIRCTASTVCREFKGRGRCVPMRSPPIVYSPPFRPVDWRCPVVGCTKELRPVCGSNGQTYANQCLLSKAACDGQQVTFVSNGECPPATTTEKSAPEPGEGPCEVYCADVFAPVCGSDGVTYPNACNLISANCYGQKVRQLHKGPCGSKC